MPPSGIPQRSSPDRMSSRDEPFAAGGSTMDSRRRTTNTGDSSIAGHSSGARAPELVCAPGSETRSLQPRSAPGALAFVAVAAVALANALAGCAATVEEPPARALHPMVGEAAPAIHQGGIDGGLIDLPVEGAKVTIVDFFASWCEPCARSLPQLDAFVTEHEADGLALVLVSLDDDPKAAGAFLDRIGVKRPATVDPKLAIAKRFKVAKLPATFVVNEKGTVVWSGKEVDSAHDAALEALGKLVPPPTVPAYPGSPETRPLQLPTPHIR